MFASYQLIRSITNLWVIWKRKWLPGVSSVVPSLTAWSLGAQLRAGEATPSLFPVPSERGQGVPHPQPRKWLRPSASHSEKTPGSILKHQLFTRQGRVSCEANSIGATGAKPSLLGRTTICIGDRIIQPAQNKFIIGSDYAGLLSRLP